MRKRFQSKVIGSSSIGTEGALEKPREASPPMVGGGPAAVNNAGGNGYLVVYAPGDSIYDPWQERLIEWRNGLIVTDAVFRTEIQP